MRRRKSQVKCGYDSLILETFKFMSGFPGKLMNLVKVAYHVVLGLWVKTAMLANLVPLR